MIFFSGNSNILIRENIFTNDYYNRTIIHTNDKNFINNAISKIDLCNNIELFSNPQDRIHRYNRIISNEYNMLYPFRGVDIGDSSFWYVMLMRELS